MSNKHEAQLVSVVFRLERSKLARLRKLAAASRIRQSEFLREAIGNLLAKHANTPSHPRGPRREPPLVWSEVEALPALPLQLAWERSHLTCGCGRSYTWAEYLALPPPLAGSQQPSEDDEGRPILIELRQCACHNTMARLPSPCPPGWPL